jgi:hypothetical protein
MSDLLLVIDIFGKYWLFYIGAALIAVLVAFSAGQRLSRAATTVWIWAALVGATTLAIRLIAMFITSKVFTVVYPFSRWVEQGSSPPAGHVSVRITILPEIGYSFDVYMVAPSAACVAAIVWMLVLLTARWHLQR